MIERRRRAQRTHHVRAVRHRQHAQRNGDRRAAAAAARGARRIECIARSAVDRVVGMTAQPEFGRIGAADEQCAGRAHAREDRGIRLSDLASEDRRAFGGHHARGRADVLGRLRKAMQRSAALSACELGIALGCLGAQRLTVHRGNDGVDARVVAIDLGEIGVEHLDARDLARVDGAGQCDGVEFDDRVGGLA